MSRDAREFEVVVWGATGFTGKLVAELICGDPPHVDPHPYAADRFA